MKYTEEIIIDLPRDRVVELFDNVDNMKKWMEGLESFETIEGEPGQVGAKSKLVFDMKGKKMEMIETITVRNLPDEFSGTYEAPGVFNLVKNKFVEISPNQTKYISEQEFQFTNIMMKIIGFFMGGAFKKQSMKYLQDFKNFAESAG